MKYEAGLILIFIKLRVLAQDIAILKVFNSKYKRKKLF